MSESSRLIVGLGNPDKEYEYTRHNFGFLAVATLAKKYGLKFSKSAALKSFITEGEIEEHKTYLLLPLTYMNNSGVAVKEALRKKNIDLQNMLVVCDDLNLNFGQFRLRSNGSGGGHNGLTSVINHLSSQDFARLRLGIGSPGKKEDMVDFVLSPFSSQQKKELPGLLAKAAQCCVLWLKEGTAQAMNQFNKRKENE